MVRISAQLIDVETDEHIWSETYDRELTEIFAIQSEVAKKIAGILQLKLSAKETVDIHSTGTENITAYDYFLRAREQFNKTGWGDDTGGTIELLQHAISLDPSFTEAYALLSRALHGSFYLSRELWLDSALALANEAIALGPNYPEGYVARAMISLYSLGDNTKAGRDFEKAYALDPNNPLVLLQLGFYLIRNDDANRGVPMVIKSIDISWGKKDPEYYLRWGMAYADIGEFDRTRELFLQAEKLAPDWVEPKDHLGWLNTMQGKHREATSYFLKANNPDAIAWSYYRAGDLKKAEEYWLRLLALEEENEDSTSYMSGRQRLGMVYWDMGDKEKAMRFFNEQIRLNQNDIERDQVSFWESLAGSRYDMAITKAYMGKTEEALDLIEHEDIFWDGPLVMSWWLDNDPMFAPVRNDPRFVAVADRERDKAEAARRVFRRIIREGEASEQLKFEAEK
jgi:tetratricopeptide (TPR) repeat protein